ncbi:MAG: hypothetical protein KDD42_08075, partial [Bdellovibrionales bacterium]|nr:hypothetical protein [Bdellovibrionales bacterium]
MQLEVLIVLQICLGTFLPSSVFAEGLCATVKIEIPQELTLERQAFDARMRINNALESQTVDNVSIAVTFADEHGNSILATSDPNATNAAFFIRIDTMDGIAAINGEGTIQPRSAAEIHWLIIPSPGAAGGSLGGKLYTVDADLSYSIGGKPYHHEVAPDFITVKPQPELELDYFLTEHVRGDEPFTPEVEPIEPFLLGVRVKNSGFGPANNLAIESAQPRIVENKQGLLIGFEITGSFVDDQPAEPSLLISFGDIQPKSTKVGSWVLESSLSGTFQSFAARFSHAAELGGKLTSLLTRTSAHFLIKDVLVDLPGRDRVRDFLAADGGIVRTYESSGVDTVVTDYDDTYQLVPGETTTYGQRFSIAVPPTSGMFLVRAANPLGKGYVVTKAVRNDGKVLSLQNAWTGARGTGSNTVHFVGLFDSNGGGTYEIELSSLSHLPQPPTLQFIPNFVRSEGQRLSFVVQGSDPNGTIPTLSLDLKPIGAKFDDNGDGFGYFDWQIGVGQGGRYPL